MSNDNPYTDAYLVKYPEGDSSLERNPYTPSSTTTTKLYTVREGDTIQNIAFRFYGDSGSWYKIADTNNLVQPFTDLVEGLVITIPL